MYIFFISQTNDKQLILHNKQIFEKNYGKCSRITVHSRGQTSKN